MNPLDYTYFIDRTDYAGGDCGFEVPIATCERGTWFASFSRGHLLEPVPMSEMTEVDTGTGYKGLTYIKCSGDGIGGHEPYVILRDCHVPTLPIFVDDGPPADGIRLEGHETVTYPKGKHFPVLNYIEEPLALGQSGYTRNESSSVANRGDSGVPSFAKVGDRIGFLCQEVFLSGARRANYRAYLEALVIAKKMDPTVQWEELRFSVESDDPADDPEPEPEPVVVERRVERIILLYNDGTSEETTL